MCNLVELNNAFVAEIKLDYIINIMNQADKCHNITRIVLFGSSTDDSCRKDSDIDIAVFGKEDRLKYLRSKEFKDFHRSLFSFGEAFEQNYDILYYTEGEEYTDDIMKAVENGVEIYRRKTA